MDLKIIFWIFTVFQSVNFVKSHGHGHVRSRSQESQEQDEYSSQSSSSSQTGDGIAAINPGAIRGFRGGGQTAVIGQNGIHAVQGGDTAIIGPNAMIAQSNGGQKTAIINGMGTGGFPFGMMAGMMANMMNQAGSMNMMGNGWNGNVIRTNSWTGFGNGGNFVNNGGTVITGGGTGVYQNCMNNFCQTCFNGHCYNRTYPAVIQRGMCAPTACEYNCVEFVFVGDENCPVCRCNGFSTKELCDSNKDCSKNGRCEKQICRYPSLTGKFSPICEYSFQCPGDKECHDGRCRSVANNRRHAEKIACVYVNQCPSGFGICQDMTCWKDGSSSSGGTAVRSSDHVSGISCTFDYQCPTQYSCRDMSCIRTGEEHGTSACALNSQCRLGERCVNMTCKRNRG